MTRFPIAKMFAALCLLGVLSSAAATAPPAATAPDVQTAASEPAPSEAQVSPAPEADEVDEAPRIEEVDVRGRFDAVFDEAQVRILRLLANLPLLIAAALIVVVAVWGGGFVSRRLHWLRLRTRNPYLDGLIRRAVQAVIVVIGVLVALDLLNATALVGAMLGSAGVLGLALGFAFKDIAENYIAGVLLSLRRPFEPGDSVRIDSYEGKVAALSARAMVLVTAEGNELRLPNALVFKAVILNFSSNPRRRFEFTIEIDASQSIRAAQTEGLAQIAGIEDVLDDPAPSWAVVDYTSAGVMLRFFGWVDQRKSDLGKTRSEAIRLVKAGFWRAGIQSPRATTHVVIGRETPAARQTSPDQHEPATSMGADTSVNRDIDRQVAQVRDTDDRNLLTPRDVTA